MMEIRTVAQTAPAPSASTVQKPPQLDQQVLGANSADQPKLDVPADAPVKAPAAPPIPRIRADIRYDESIQRVVGLIYDETTGEPIREVPPEELRALYAKTRAMLGPLVDEKA
jgi:hypothetical protein